MVSTVALSPIFWVLVIIIGYQYVRMRKIKEYLFGLRDNSVVRITLISTVLGIIGGILGSLLMVFLGITIPVNGIYYVFFLAIFLMLIHPRFLCFAYAGGVLSLTSLIFGFPDLNVPHLMALIAVLHMVESILIRISGHLDALPVYVRNGWGQGVGGFNLQKFWPVPLTVLTIYTGINPVETGIFMPEWWPLLKTEIVDNNNMAYGLVPVVVGLGYGELALTDFPQRRSRLSARILGLYSFILLILAVIASYISGFKWIAAIFSPLGHELVIRWSQQKEMKGEPKFTATSRGIMLLDVIRPSPASKAGLRTGDIITKIGDHSVRTRFDLDYALHMASDSVRVSYWRTEEISKEEQVEKLGWTILTWTPQEPWGMILAPGYGIERYLDFQGSGRLSHWLKKMKKRS